MSRLSLKGLGVTLRGRTIFSGLQADFQAGQVTAILGPNGAGKSTLMACLAGLRRPDQGLVTLDGAQICAMSPRDRARRLAFLPQSPEIAWAVDSRILVGLGRTPHIGARGLSLRDAEAIERAMQIAGVEAFAGRIVTTLSGGERARVLIARALAGEPEWLLADEPFTGLDPGHQLDAAALFRRLAHLKGLGVVLTLHDLSLAVRMADRILVLAGGGVIAEGTPAEALTPKVLARAYGVEANIHEAPGGLVVDVTGRAGEGGSPG